MGTKVGSDDQVRRTQTQWEADTVVHPEGLRMYVYEGARAGQFKVADGTRTFLEMGTGAYFSPGTESGVTLPIDEVDVNGLPADLAAKQPLRSELTKYNTPAANIVAASTTDLDASTGDQVTIIGAGPIDIFTLANGASRKLVFSAGTTITHDPTHINCEGGADITTENNDTGEVWSFGSGLSVLLYKRASGQPIVRLPQTGVTNLVGDLADLSDAIAASRPYKVYTAQITQIGIAAPTDTDMVQENTLPGTVSFTYDGEGSYSLANAGVFTAGKTWFSPQVIYDPINLGAYISITQSGKDGFSITTATAPAGVASDGLLNIFFEVRVYN